MIMGPGEILTTNSCLSESDRLGLRLRFAWETLHWELLRCQLESLSWDPLLSDSDRCESSLKIPWGGFV